MKPLSKEAIGFPAWLNDKSLDELEDLYHGGQISLEMVELAVKVANCTPGRFNWVSWQSGAFRLYDKDRFNKTGTFLRDHSTRR